jgi:hypothetical protein
MDIQKSQARNNGLVEAVLAGHSFNREAEIKPIERGPPSTVRLRQSSSASGTRAKLQPIAAFPYPSSMLAILFDCQLAPITRTTTKDEDDLRTGDGQSGIARIVQLYPLTYRAVATRLPVLQQSPKRVPSSEPSLRPDLQCPVMISFYSIDTRPEKLI